MKTEAMEVSREKRKLDLLVKECITEFRASTFREPRRRLSPLVKVRQSVLVRSVHLLELVAICARRTRVFSCAILVILTLRG